MRRWEREFPGPPEPPDGEIVWKALTVVLLLAGAAGTFMGYGLGVADERVRQAQVTFDLHEAQRQAEASDSIADTCVRAFNQLDYEATLALMYTQSAHEVMEAFLEGQRQPEIEYVAEID